MLNKTLVWNSSICHLYNPYTSSHSPIYFKSSLDDLQYLIQHKYYVYSCKYNVNAMYSRWPETNSSFDLGNFLKFFFSSIYDPGIQRTDYKFNSVQLLSRVWLFVTPWTAACQASLSITNSWSLLKLMPIESVMPSNHLILCHPLLLPPSIFPSIRVFSDESVLCIRWPEYWSLSFSISPSQWILRTDFL